MHGVGDLAVHVELELRRGRVPDPDGLRALVPGKPSDLVLGEAPLARGPVHDLELIGRSGHRAQQPVAPSPRLLVVSEADERVQRERRVTQPAVAVVPVAHAADPLGQRRGRRRDDPAGRRVRERLERDRRAVHQLRVALVGARLRPLAPPRGRLGDGAPRVAWGWSRVVRREPREHERHGVALVDGELGDVTEILRLHRDRRVQAERVRSADGLEHSVLRLHPRDDRPVVEADDELGPHRDPAANALHQAHDVDVLVADRHAVDDANRSFGSLELRLEHESAVAVAPARRPAARGGRDLPVAVLLGAEQRGKACVRVEPRCAEPVDRAVVGDQRNGLRVADERVLLDAGGHRGVRRLGRALARTRRAAARARHAMLRRIRPGGRPGRRRSRPWRRSRVRLPRGWRSRLPRG